MAGWSSGSGMTTISFLVPRPYEATLRSVRIDGIDVHNNSHAALAETILLVALGTHFFHESIKGNWLCAKPDATEAEIVKANRAAQIHDLIPTLPDGYETAVGEHGYRLPGGEKQRQVLARVLLQDPRIVYPRRSCCARLSTIQNADQIVVLDRDCVVGGSRHADLVAANPNPWQAAPRDRLRNTSIGKGYLQLYTLGAT
ncbi:ATP-binding cassette domain-containing protein [Kribbella sp. WER1]